MTAKSDIASERVEIRLTRAQLADWTRLAKSHGLTIKALVVEAVAAYAARGDESDLADLGRAVLALTHDHDRSVG